MKGVFDTKPDSGYDDDIARRYHFPAQYLEVARQIVGEWVLYREPRRNRGRQAYVATARVESIEPDPRLKDHYYAIVGNYISFDPSVPFMAKNGYREAPLRAVGTSRVGAALQGKSVRLISDEDFAAIAREGLRETLSPDNEERFPPNGNQWGESAEKFIHDSVEEQEREVVQILRNQKIRDANFRRQVCEAYDNTCAVTRLRIINGGGRAEVQAAHIWPVADGGPDLVRNGLALSGTIHWLFDRHLISLTNDWRLLVSHNRVPAELRGLFSHQNSRIHLPKDERLWPLPRYMEKHRTMFEGKAA